MISRVVACCVWFAMLSSTACDSSRLASGGRPDDIGEGLTDALQAFLQHRVEVEKKDVGMVVAFVDARGSHVVSCGKLDDGTDHEVNGDTLFEIGSITKTFTGLLLQDMVGRGEMNFDDPVAKYLPPSVKLPTYRGRQITLLQLATHTSGLPDNPDNLDPARADNSRADYSFEKLDAFVSGYTLTREPGSKYEYSTVGIALLAHAIELKAGLDYESLVVDRICRPLEMGSTRIALTPAMKSRFAQGHNYYGYRTSHTDWGALKGGAALRSTANDLLKYLSANLDLGSSGLTPIMAKTHSARFHAHLDTDTGVDTDIGVTWMLMHDTEGSTFIGHGGLTRGFTTFIGFDTARRRGVAVLSNSLDLDVARIGRILLEREWNPNPRPMEMKAHGKMDDLVGQYRISPAQAVGALTRHGVGIRREGDRLFVQITGPDTWPKHVLTPPVTDELLPVSESAFFERYSGVALTFSRNARGRISSFSGRYRGQTFSYDKISDQPPEVPAPPEPSLPILLDAEHLDAVVGQYEMGPDAAAANGLILRIWREGDHLLGRASAGYALQGAFEIDPASETEFFVPVDGSRLVFTKNSDGGMAVVIHHRDGQPDLRGKKPPDTTR